MANETKFKVGDTVKLKAGGPDMTIQVIHPKKKGEEKTEHYRCQWFAGKKLEAGMFPAESLEAVDSDGK